MVYATLFTTERYSCAMYLFIKPIDTIMENLYHNQGCLTLGSIDQRFTWIFPFFLTIK
jgi:hypothetical protein